MREIARGGMGVVLEVRHPNVPERALALKLILERAGAASTVMKRFEREAQTLAQVDRHPNVLKVHQLGQDQGRYFLVTDLVAGEPLSKKVPLEPRRAAVVVRKLADAVAHVHSKGILHRDLKPDNAILRADVEDEPVLIDFGLAWVAEADRLTKTGSTLGTPAYMAPEQAQSGHGAHLDERADVYGLGGTLYAALTGQAPFDADSMHGLMTKILLEPPEPPSHARRDVPRALDAICAVALAKKPQDRYASAAALRDDLDRFLRGERPVALDRAPALARRSARRVALAGLAAVVVLAALGGALALARRAKGRSDRAALVALAEEAGRAASRARRSADAKTRLETFETVLAQAAASEEAREDPAVRRLLAAGALLRAERDAARAPADAARAARDWIVASREPLDFARDDLFADLPQREATLGAALATTDPSLARELVARPEGPHPSTALRVERARALLRLGTPGAAAREASRGAAGNDATAFEARTILVRASLETRDLATARTHARALLAARPDAASRALAVEVELALGDVDAAGALLDAASSGASAPELAPARAAVALARGDTGGAALALASEAARVAPSARVGLLRATAQLVAELESYRARIAPPRWDAVATLASDAISSAGLDDAPSAADALVLSAALARARGDAAGADDLLLRAAARAPASVDVALALARRAAVAQPPLRDRGDFVRPIVRVAGEVQDPPLAAALRALALLASSGKERDALPGVELGATNAASARDRARLAVLAAALGRESNRRELVDLGQTGRSELGRLGALEERLLEIGRERVAFEEDAHHGLVVGIAGLAEGRARVGPTSRAAVLREGRALRASRARGDVAVGLSALDLLVAIAPESGDARLARARAIALAVSPEWPHVLAERPRPAQRSEAVSALVAARGGESALADEGLADLALVPATNDTLEGAERALVRGRLLVARGRFSEAIQALRSARDQADRAWRAGRHDDSVPLARVVLAQRVRTASLAEHAAALARAKDEVASSGARSEIGDDLETLGEGLAAALAAQHRLEEAVRAARKAAPDSALAPAASEAEAALRGCPDHAPLLEPLAEARVLLESAPIGWATAAREAVARGAVAGRPALLLHRAHEFLAGRADANATALDAVLAPARGDPAAPLARAMLRLGTVLVRRGALAPGEREALLAGARPELAYAKELAPGCAAVNAQRAALEELLGRTAAASARFELVRELDAWTGRPHEAWLLAAATALAAGDEARAKEGLDALVREAQGYENEDAWVLAGPVFRAAADRPALQEILDKLVYLVRTR